MVLRGRITTPTGSVPLGKLLAREIELVGTFRFDREFAQAVRLLEENRIAAQLPRPDIDLTLLVPYDRGDVVSRLHEHADVRSVEHGANGTHIEARVPAWMVGDLADFDVSTSPA